MLIEHLPPDCALARAANGHAWSAANYQMANLQDGLEGIRRQVAASAGAKNMPSFKPAPRPETRAAVGDVQQDDVKALLDSLKPPKLELIQGDGP